MSTKILRSLVLASFLGGLVLVGVGLFNQGRSYAAGSSSGVTISDLTQAGFTQIKQISPNAAGKFNGPNLYFGVSDKVTSPTSEAPSLVMVDNLSLPYKPSTGALFNYGADSHPFSISGGTGQEATMADGRVAINFVKNNNYVVVIGPNQQKIEALAQIMAGKIQ